MATYIGVGLSNQLATWRSPPNQAATVLPGVNDLIGPGAGTLEFNANGSHRALFVGSQSNVILYINNVTLTITQQSQIEGQILNDGVLIMQGRVLFGRNTQWNGQGTYRLANGANGVFNSPAQLGIVVIESGASVTLTADCTFDSLTVDNGGSLTLGTGAGVRTSPTITNNGAIVVNTRNANDNVVITAAVAGNAATITQGNIIGSGNPTAASLPGTSLDTALAVSLGTPFGGSFSGFATHYFYVPIAPEVVYHATLTSKTGDVMSVVIQTTLDWDTLTNDCYLYNEDDCEEFAAAADDFGQEPYCVVTVQGGMMGSGSYQITIDTGTCP